MTALHRPLSCALLVAGALLAGSPCRAADAPGACPDLSPIQRRIVEHANEGMASLRSFVWMTDQIYGIGMWEVVTSLDHWRQAVACERLAAAARGQDGTASVATK